MTKPKRRSPEMMAAATKILKLYTESAVEGMQCPVYKEVATIAGCSYDDAVSATAWLATCGDIKLEYNASKHRRIFVKSVNKYTKWTGSGSNKPEYIPRPAKPKGQVTMRRCLRCREQFDSAGPHNRLCGPCKEQMARDGSHLGMGGIFL